MVSLGRRSRKTSSHYRSDSAQLSAYPRSPSLASATTPSPRSSIGFSYSPTAHASTSRTDSDNLIETRHFASSSSTTRPHSLYSSNHAERQPQPQPQPPTDQHPYGSLMSSSVRDNEEDEDLCPVCLCELSLRLQGERPHVVPVCGHRLRESQSPTSRCCSQARRALPEREAGTSSTATLTSFSPFDFSISHRSRLLRVSFFASIHPPAAQTDCARSGADLALSAIRIERSTETSTGLESRLARWDCAVFAGGI